MNSIAQWDCPPEGIVSESLLSTELPSLTKYSYTDAITLDAHQAIYTRMINEALTEHKAVKYIKKLNMHGVSYAPIRLIKELVSFNGSLLPITFNPEGCLSSCDCECHLIAHLYQDDNAPDCDACNDTLREAIIYMRKIMIMYSYDVLQSITR